MILVYHVTIYINVKQKDGQCKKCILIFIHPSHMYIVYNLLNPLFPIPNPLYVYI